MSHSGIAQSTIFPSSDFLPFYQNLSWKHIEDTWYQIRIKPNKMWIDISAEHLRFWSGWIGVEKLGEIHCSWRALTKSLVALLWRSWRCKKFVQSAYSQVFTNVHRAKKVSTNVHTEQKVHKCSQLVTILHFFCTFLAALPTFKLFSTNNGEKEKKIKKCVKRISLGSRWY